MSIHHLCRCHAGKLNPDNSNIIAHIHEHLDFLYLLLRVSVQPPHACHMLSLRDLKCTSRKLCVRVTKGDSSQVEGAYQVHTLFLTGKSHMWTVTLTKLRILKSNLTRDTARAVEVIRTYLLLVPIIWWSSVATSIGWVGHQ